MQQTIVSQARHELNPAAMASTLEEAGFYYFLRSPNVARFGEWVDDPKIPLAISTLEMDDLCIV
jgi:hypothetical protein